MDTLEHIINAARGLAAQDAAVGDELMKFIRQKLFQPRVEKAGSLADLQRVASTLGDSELRVCIMLMPETKLRKLWTKVDRHSMPPEAAVGSELQAHILALVSGDKEPATAPAKTARRPAENVAANLPNIREVYREGGTDAVSAAIARLPLKSLKSIVKEQELKASVSKGKSADDLRKFIQLAAKEELGQRSDVFRAIAAASEGDEP